jgi:glycosyltransferase involved in cell wall biosynthesis
VEKKGLHILRELAGRLPDCQWVFIGWGPDDPAGWGLPNVRTLGAIPHAELPRYYRAADLLVLPSSGEGFPLVVQEAMACGTPALISPDTASGAAGVEQAALVCELGPEELAACLQDWLARPDDLLARRSVVARYAQDHWDWDACAARYHELYRRLLPAARQAETKDEQS